MPFYVNLSLSVVFWKTQQLWINLKNRKHRTFLPIMQISPGKIYRRKSPFKAPMKTEPTTLEDLLKRDGNSSPQNEILCMISYCNFPSTSAINASPTPSDQEQQHLKLAQLLCLIKSPKKPLDRSVLSPLMSMISTAIFRQLPPPSKVAISSNFLDEDEVASVPSPTWPYLQMVYTILQWLVSNTETEKLSEFIGHPFLIKMLAHFQSENSRERESLKNIYHRIYCRFTSHRSFMRKSMTTAFLDYVFGEERNCGVGEMLEIWGAIINGFAVPLKDEHKFFLERVLIPLHKSREMQVYQKQLAYCVTQFVQKEPALGERVVRGILKHWPITNYEKEVLLIGELDDLIKLIDLDHHDYSAFALILCSQSTRCSTSLNSQIAERALYLWNNEQFVKIASQAMEKVFPVIVEGIEKNLKGHWSSTVKQMTQNVKTMLREMDPVLYSTALQQIQTRETLALQEELKRKAKWERLEMEAANQCQIHNAYLKNTVQKTALPNGVKTLDTPIEN